MNQTKFPTHFGNFTIERFPNSNDQSLKAWDAADEQILECLFNKKPNIQDSKIIIFNDAFGALSIALNKYNVLTITDSFLTQLSIINNAKINHIDLEKNSISNSLRPIDKPIDFLLIKLPKSTDHFLDFLSRIHQKITPNTKIIIASLQRNIPKTFWSLLEKYFKNIKPQRARKKAKLIEVNELISTPKILYPKTFNLEKTDLKIFNHANVFSKNSLDIGARFFIDNFPEINSPKNIIDLGCGNGVLGTVMAEKHKDSIIHFVDESFMAIESAKLTVEFNFKNHSRFKFEQSHGLQGWPENSVDLIVCNPPFHQNQTVGTHIAFELFHHSFKTLKPRSSFYVVANRHLPYYSKLKQIFSSVKTIASNQKFNLYLAIK